MSRVVYVLYRGEYEDRRVVGVYTTRQRAEADYRGRADELDITVEEFHGELEEVTEHRHRWVPSYPGSPWLAYVVECEVCGIVERLPVLTCGLRDTPHEAHVWDASVGWPGGPQEALKACPGIVAR